MGEKVYIAINPLAGWDCIYGMFSKREAAVDHMVNLGFNREKIEENEEDECFIHECFIN